MNLYQNDNSLKKDLFILQAKRLALIWRSLSKSKCWLSRMWMIHTWFYPCIRPVTSVAVRYPSDWYSSAGQSKLRMFFQQGTRDSVLVCLPYFPPKKGRRDKPWPRKWRIEPQVERSEFEPGRRLILLSGKKFHSNHPSLPWGIDGYLQTLR